MIKVVDITAENLAKFEKYMGLLKHQLSEDSLWLGALINDFPCGVLLARKSLKESTVCDINHIFVPAPLRREGIATCLFDALLEKCKKLGYEELLFNAVLDKKTIENLDAFLKNYGFEPLEIVSNVYIFDDLESILANKYVQRAISGTFKLPKGIEILPLKKVDKALLEEVKREINIEYPDYYALFQVDNLKDLPHINTFVAVANGKKVIGWLTGLDFYGTKILYKTFFVEKKYRDLGMGFFLMNACVKNQFLRFKETPAMCLIALKNSNAEKFNSAFFKGVKKRVSHEVLRRKRMF